MSDTTEIERIVVGLGNNVARYYGSNTGFPVKFSDEASKAINQLLLKAKIEGAKEIMILVGRTSMHSDAYAALRAEADKYLTELQSQLKEAEK